MGKRIKSALALALSLCCALCLSVSALAADTSAALTVNYAWEGKAVPGVTFSLYRVADHNSYDEYILSGDFAGYAVTIDARDTGSLASAASTLSAYAARDGVKPAYTVVTDTNGKATVSNLTSGVWLVVGQRTEVDGYVYTTAPFLAEVKTEDTTADAAPKAEREKITEDTVDRRVLKVWKDDGNESARPKEIQVELLKDGTVVDTVTLNAENSWAYTWKGLEANHDWKVTEKTVASGYTVSNSTEGVTFVITNTKTSTTPNTPTTPGKLPQTGQLWWPVPVLAAAGILAVAIGVGLNKGKKHE